MLRLQHRASGAAHAVHQFYETAAAEGFLDYDKAVQYPFGYGLSYTTFTQEMSDISVSGTGLPIDVTVTNTGSVAGKEVVEVYYNPPYTDGGIEKSAVNLVEYAKTGLLDQLTVTEMDTMISLAGFQTAAIESVGKVQTVDCDGPASINNNFTGMGSIGFPSAVMIAATCFPTASAVANSWDVALGEEIGQALGEEAAAQDVAVLLGPGLNMKRNPLCGRNFEYFSEDPYLAGKLAAGYIRGIQSKGIAACPKHFAVNSQETRRMASDSIVDERTLREIYLTGFEIAVKEGKPRTIMSAYNLINGEYANESKHLLVDILRDEWGFTGAVVTDWGGSNDHALGVKVGSTLEMPAPGGDSVRELLAAVQSGKISESDVDARLKELMPLVFDTRAANEVAQIYISKTDSAIFRPAKELKAFARVTLAPGEKQRVSIVLDDKAFRFWNVKSSRWETEGGRYEIMVGASVQDIRLQTAVMVKGTATVFPYDAAALDCYKTADVKNVSDEAFAALLGHPIPQSKTIIDRNLTLGELNHTRAPLGWLIWAVLTYLLNASCKRGKPDLNITFQYNMPLRALAKMTGGMVSMGMVDGLVMELKGFWFIGLIRVIYEFIKNQVQNAAMEKRLKGGA